MGIIICVVFAGGLGIGMLIQFLYRKRNSKIKVEKFTSTNNSMPKFPTFEESMYACGWNYKVNHGNDKGWASAKDMYDYICRKLSA